MTGRYTLTIIKPTAVRNNHLGEILSIINHDGGYRIAALKLTSMDKKEAQNFYKVHKERPFFSELTDFMSSGPVVVAVLEKDNAVLDYRNYIGATDPTEAPAGTIRHMFGTNKQANAVHGSDSDENAIREIQFFFSANEIYDIEGNIIEL